MQSWISKPVWFPVRVDQLVCSAFVIAGIGVAHADTSQGKVGDELSALSPPSLDGTGNHNTHDRRGAAGTPYRRIAPPSYADGVGARLETSDLRYISNRIFADGGQNFFTPTGATQWAYNWGQFVDHTIGLRETGDEPVAVQFDASDPLEMFTNEAGGMTFTRTAMDSGTGETTPREHANTVSSYIDAWAVYGGTEERLEWLREGPVDGDMSNNGARLLLTEDAHLPLAAQRGDAGAAPVMELVGRLRAIPDADQQIVIAGDQRANENIALTAAHTLFAREHNRIVDMLPESLTAQRRFDIARQVVIATQQYITYNEFLPSLGVQLPATQGYRADLDASVSQEFATVGYRAHSMIHGEIEMAVDAAYFTATQLADFRSQGIEIEAEDEALELAVPLNVAFANPQLVKSLGVGTIALGLASEPQYKNDEQIDNQLRSVLFQMPHADVQDPDACLDGPELPECFRLVHDLGSLDIFRGRDHGMAPYNEMRAAFGLSRVESFSELTGEATDAFPADDPEISNTDPINDPSILDFVALYDKDGRLLEAGSDEADSDATLGIRRTTLAARLKALYGDVDKVDAFVGMVSEPTLPGSDLGALQHAIWSEQFVALRDGDAHFYEWNASLQGILAEYGSLGITHRQSLADIVVNNTELGADEVPVELFRVLEEPVSTL